MCETINLNQDLHAINIHMVNCLCWVTACIHIHIIFFHSTLIYLTEWIDPWKLTQEYKSYYVMVHYIVMFCVLFVLLFSGYSHHHSADQFFTTAILECEAGTSKSHIYLESGKMMVWKTIVWKNNFIQSSTWNCGNDALNFKMIFKKYIRTFLKSRK